LVKMRSVRSQMMLFFSLLTLVPILLSFVHVYYVLQNYLENSYSRQQKQSIDNLASDIDDWRAKREELSLQIFGDRHIQQFLKHDDLAHSVEQLQRTSEFRQALQTYVAASDTPVSVFVVHRSGVIYGEGLNGTIAQYICARLKLAERHAGSPVWENAEPLQQIVLFRRINDTESDLNRRIGYLFLMFHKADFERMIHRYIVNGRQEYALFDLQNTFRFQTDKETPESFIREIAEKPSRSGRILALEKKQYVTFAETRRGWTLVSWIPKGEVLKPARELIVGILFSSALLLLFSVFMVFFLSHRITKPLKMLQRKLGKIGSGSFVVSVPVVRNDEIGELAMALNRMSKEIADLIQKNKEEENKRRLLQLQTLEYQINPHFLYNTLDSVNMLARKHNDTLIADIVTYLSRLFRISLNQGREMITVEEELRHVTYYLKIQEIRFVDQLYWEIQADDSLMRVRIIKFLLQPLVENSINHGIRKRSEPGYIYIRVWAEPDHLVLEVEDDGVGMDAERLEQVRQSLNEWGEEHEQHLGFGLRNVHQRIRLHYGPGYGLTINSEKNGGTTVTIRLPYHPEDQK